FPQTLYSPTRREGSISAKNLCLERRRVPSGYVFYNPAVTGRTRIGLRRGIWVRCRGVALCYQPTPTHHPPSGWAYGRDLLVGKGNRRVHGCHTFDTAQQRVGAINTLHHPPLAVCGKSITST